MTTIALVTYLEYNDFLHFVAATFLGKHEKQSGDVLMNNFLIFTY